MKTWQRRLWKGIAAVFAAVVIALATVIGVFRLLAPLVPGYRVEVERWAARALDRPVSIAGMGARWDWYGPEITLDDVKLYSHNGKYVVITARQIRFGVTLRALLHGSFSAPSRIILLQPHVVAIRAVDGTYSLRGFGREAGQIGQLDWRNTLNDAFSQQAEILIRDGSLRLIDMRQPGLPMVFGSVDINLDNAADTHRIAGRLQLPQTFGRTLGFTANVDGEGLHPENWEWQVSVEGAALNVPRWLSYWPQYPNRFASGTLDLRGEIAGNGAALSRLKLHVGARDLMPAGSPSAQGFSALAGDVDWMQTNSGWTLGGRHIALTRAGESWPESNFRLEFSKDSQETTWQGNASFLRLQDIDVLLDWLPPGATNALLQRMQRLAPEGDLTNVGGAAHWQNASLDRWSVQGRFKGLGAHADGSIPGFTGMDGELALDQTGGTATLDSRNGSVTFPHLFRSPLYATVLNAKFQFTHNEQGWRIASDGISVRNPDASATGKGSLLFPADGSSPQLDLDAAVTDADARNKSAYFPVGIMPKEVVSWLDSAIVSGQVPEGTLSVHGKLADFPFDNGQGVFDIRFHLIHGVLDYANGWPKVENLDADVDFHNQGLSAVVLGGSVLGDDITGAKAGFADLRDGVLRIDGGARGSAQASLDFLRSGPLKERFGSYLDPVKVSGRSDVTLHLVLPVDQLGKYKLDGVAQLRDVSVGVEGAPAWALSKVHGAVHFSGTGISADKVKGVLLGAPVTINLHPGSGDQADATLFDAHGGAESAALTRAFALPVQAALQGATGWNAQGRIPNNPAAGTARLSLQLTSDLKGLEIGLPAPFAKPAEAVLPLGVTLAIQRGGKLQLGIRYAERADGLLQFVTHDRRWQFDRGEFSVNDGPATLPAQPGLSVIGKLDAFNVADWKPFADGHIEDGATDAPQLPAFLRHVDLHVERFSGFGQIVSGLHIGLDREAADWKLDVASAAIGGEINLPLKVDAAHPIVAAMDHVTLNQSVAASAPKSASAETKTTYDPRRIPAMRFTSKLLQFSGVSLTQVSAAVMPRPDGLNLSEFSVDGRTFKAQASGSWTVQPDGTQQSALDAHITSSDIEQTLKAFGYAPGITGNSAALDATISWAGDPFGKIVPSLNGTLHLKLAKGQLLEVQPGAGRVFGLLSLNALPRRLLLNFSDVFGKGFAYDNIEGNFTLQNGDAYTRDLTISGPAAKIHVIGRIGLAKHDFDEALIVDASVGSTLPVLGALAGGVGVGAVVWLLTEVFKKPLTAVGEVRYRLTGPWDNPKLEKVAESPRKTPPPKPSQPQAAHP